MDIELINEPKIKIPIKDLQKHGIHHNILSLKSNVSRRKIPK